MSEHRSSPPADSTQRELDGVVLRTRMNRIGRKILVLSGKGGVGKSTVAANLAVALAAAGKKVGLLDVDIHGPSLPRILGLEGRRLGPDGSGAIRPVELGRNLKVVSLGLLLDSATDAVIWRGPMKYGVIRQFLKDVNWGELDFLVLDSPPGTGDEPLAVAQLVGGGAEAVVVTTPQDVAVADVRRSVSFCQTLSLHVIGIVENMSGLVCPHCRQEIAPFKTGGGEKLAAEMGVPFLGRIPLDPEIATSGDDGKPFLRDRPESIAAKAFAAVVAPILEGNDESKPQHDPDSRKDTTKMKIAVPTVDGKLCMHFGHCELFALVEVDDADKRIVSTDYLPPPAHEPGALPRWLHRQGANVIIAGGMGQRAQALFAQQDIKVIVGAPAESPEKLVSAYLTGALETGRNVCDH